MWKAALIVTLAAVLGTQQARPSASRLSAAQQRPAETIVATADELRSALRKGGIIRLRPGRYAGNFVVAAPGTTLLGMDVPARRVSPADVAAVTLAPENPTASVLSVRADRFTAVGLTFVNGDTDRAVIEAGTQDATTVDAQPRGVTFDRVAVLAGDAGGLRGLALHATDVVVRRSHIAGFWYRGRDSQAIWANNSPGPYTIEDNYLEASGENVLFGGASIKIPGVVPSDIIVRGNTLFKPQAWRKLTGSVKNLFEVKNGRRVLVEDNVLDGSWRDGQAGDGILLTPRNQYNDTPWAVVEDVVIRRNRMKNVAGYALQILGKDDIASTSSQQTRRITIEQNLFASKNGIKVVGGVDGHLTVTRNTFPLIVSNWLQLSGAGPLTPLTVTGNVFRSGDYGISGDGAGVGVRALAKYASVQAFTGNVIEKTAARTVAWPEGNTLLAPGSLGSLLDPETFRHPDRTVGH